MSRDLFRSLHLRGTRWRWRPGNETTSAQVYRQRISKGMKRRVGRRWREPANTSGERNGERVRELERTLKAGRGGVYLRRSERSDKWRGVLPLSDSVGSPWVACALVFTLRFASSPPPFLLHHLELPPSPSTPLPPPLWPPPFRAILSHSYLVVNIRVRESKFFPPLILDPFILDPS